MSAIDPTRADASIASRLLPFAPALYAATLFVSALLLFAVQPMFTKMVLPKLGGAPAIWSVAMVFFQGALLIGYAYAHLLTRMLSARMGAFVHLGLLGLAALTLPIGIAAGYATPPSSQIEFWLLGLFAASIGLPFTALAASAPLLQRWFADSGHPQAANPYVLYAASNLGSFAALLAYPILIEPMLSLRGQTAVWSAGFALLAILIAVAALVVASGVAHRKHATASSAAPSMARRTVWIALAAVPAGLVVAVTAYLSTDIAAAPFLWVLPLALYLLTFVAAFRERPWVAHHTVTLIVPFLVIPLSISMLGGEPVFWFVIVGLHLVAFFALTLLCHGELYRLRPAPEHLTDFYLCTSIGGVIGGIFTGLLAPRIFASTAEYQVLIAAALLAMPLAFARGVLAALREATPAILVAIALVALYFATPARLSDGWMIVFQIVLVLLAGLMVLQRHRPMRLFSLVVVAFTLSAFWLPGQSPVEVTRSFFGVHKVLDTIDGKYRLLFHGTTIHGVDRLKNDDGTPVTGQAEPLAYYYRGGPISEAITATRLSRGPLAHVAAVGLGTGSLACYREPGEHWTFFEIDPEVVRLARDPARFRFLATCAPDVPIVLGDARLTLKNDARRYDLILIDAFSSDAIPAHLLTREAVRGYFAQVKQGGIVMMHISNRHLELERLVAAIADAEGLVVRIKTDLHANGFPTDFKTNATVAVIARSAKDLEKFDLYHGWQIVRPDGVAPWTDDYSDLIGSLYRKKFPALAR